MQSRDLLATAKRLASGNTRPRQSDVRRAISTAYYAMFHCLARHCADYMVGRDAKSRSNPAWRQVYRAVEHGSARKACENKLIHQFPDEIVAFADTFAEMQIKRHKADYEPLVKYAKHTALRDIERIDEVINNFEHSKAKDKRAFCVLILFRQR